MTPITTIIFDWGGVLIDDPAPLLLSVFSRTLTAVLPAFLRLHPHLVDPVREEPISQNPVLGKRVLRKRGVTLPTHGPCRTALAKRQ